MKHILAVLLVIFWSVNVANAQFQINNSASQTSCNCYQLTPDAISQSGSVWNTTMIDLSVPFDFTFNVYLGTNTSGADGISFTLQPISTSVGGGGGGMGFQGIPTSFGVLIDTYDNGAAVGDIVNDHLSININGDTDHLTANNLAGPVDMGELEDGAYHSLQVSWDPVTQTFLVYMDGVLQITYIGDIINNVFGGDPMVFWGFTGATGGLSNQQAFCLELTSTIDNSALQTCSNTPAQFTDNSTSSSGVTGWQWDFGDGNASTSQNPTNTYITDGVYVASLTVTDASGCFANSSVNVTVSSPSIVGSATPINICAGQQVQLDAIPTEPNQPSCDHSISLWDSFGDGWNGATLDVLVNGVVVGTYTVAGGFGPSTYSIPVNDGDVISTVYNVLFNSWPHENYYYIYDAQGVEIFSDGGGGGGSAPVGGTTGAVSCGFTPSNYQYSWSPPATVSNPNIINPTANPITTSIYMVSMSDANNPGCIATNLVTVTVNNISVTTSQIAENCGLADGSATATGNSGTATYTYIWGNAATTSVISNLVQGTYPVTVTDNTGCVAIESVTVTGSSGLTIIDAIVPANCGLSDGEASLTVTGGTTPFNYSWSNGETTATITGISLGLYTYTVTDALGCITDGSLSVPNLGGGSLSMNSTNPQCNASNDGDATAIMTGGATPYLYSWSTTGITATITGIGPGTYSVTVSDNNNCENIGSVSLTVAAALSILSDYDDVTCNGFGDGLANVIVNGGTTPYLYSWTTGATTASITGLAGGAVAMTVTDNVGCSETTGVTITDPSLMSGATTVGDLACFGDCDGTASITITGGTPAYWMIWGDPGGSTSTQGSNMCAGTYNVTVYDANACIMVESVTFTDPSQLTIPVGNMITFNATCFGECDGSAVVIPNGGTGTLGYTWSPVPGAGQGTNVASSICAGPGSVSVTDINGCVAAENFTITEPTEFTITVSSVASNCGLPDGIGSVDAVSGSVSPYTYLWETGQVSMTASALVDGDYNVTITSAVAGGNCYTVQTVNIGSIPGPSVSAVSTPAICNGEATGTATAIGTPATGGSSVFTYVWSQSNSGQTVTGLLAGSYAVTATDAMGCQAITVTALTQPPIVNITATVIDSVVCIGQCSDLIAAATGGSGGPFTYFWDNGLGTGATVNDCPLVETSYYVYAEDVNGCASSSIFVTLSLLTPLSVNTTSDVPVICKNGDVTLIATGSGGLGTQFLTYDWGGGLTGQVVSASPTGYPTDVVYTVTVSDNCSPPATSSVTITWYDNPTPVISSSANGDCPPFTPVLMDNTSPPAVSRTWNVNGVFTQDSMSVSQTFTQGGAYDVGLSIISADGCYSSIEYPGYITVYDEPVANFIFTPQPTTVVDTEVNFSDISEGFVNIWNWTFMGYNDEGELYTLGTDFGYVNYSSFVFPEDTGWFPVRLWVSSIHGCTHDTIKNIRIDGEFTFYSPNAFTPNGDGKNDVFIPHGLGVDQGEYVLTIFNRWGELVFQTENWSEGWDGKMQATGQIMKEDVYVWKAFVKEGTTTYPEKHNYIGSVTLLK